MIDNAFLDIDNFGQAQAPADTLSVKQLHSILDTFARTYCPVTDRFHFVVFQSNLSGKLSLVSCKFKELLILVLYCVRLLSTKVN